MQDHFNMEFTYFVDDPSVAFDGVSMAYVHKSAARTFLAGAYKLLASDQVRYPFYTNVAFEKFDVVITEGINYSLLHYVRQCAPIVILNDSLSWDPLFRNDRVQYLNKYFGRSRSVVVTEKVQAIYGRYGIGIPVTVIGHPVDVSGIAFRKRSASPKRLVSVGRLVKEKGFDVIIDAVTEILGRHPEVTLDIFGAGPLQKGLATLIRQKRMEAAIHLKGQVRREELLERLLAYDLFVSHPLTLPRSSESFLMANVEAMAAGIPVITSDCGGVPYVVRDAAVVIRQRDVDGLRDAIERFVSGVEVMEARSVAGRRFVETNYALDTIATKWRDVIESIGER